MTHETGTFSFGELMGIPAIGIKGAFDFMHPKIDAWMDEKLASGGDKIMLDLTATHYITAMGLACMFKMVKKLAKNGGIIHITGATTDMVEIIRLGHLDSYVYYFAT